MKITKLRKRRKKTSKRKHNPSKGVKSMKRRKRRKSVTRSRKHNPARIVHYKKHSRRRYKRNPSMGKGIMEILVNGALAGVGAVASSFLSNMLYEKFIKGATDTPVKKNLTSIATAIFAGWAAQKFIKGEKGKAIAAGAVAGAVLVLAKNTLGLPLGLAGEDVLLGDNVNNVLDRLLGAADISGDDMLLGAADLNGDDMLLGLDDNMLLGYDGDDFSGDDYSGEELL